MKYVWREGQWVEPTFAPDLSPATSYQVMGDSYYAGLQATDGRDISSRKKHRNYMKEKGYTTVDDYKGEWAASAQRRNDYYQGKDPTRKEEVARAFFNDQNKRRP